MDRLIDVNVTDVKAGAQPPAAEGLIVAIRRDSDFATEKLKQRICGHFFDTQFEACQAVGSLNALNNQQSARIIPLTVPQINWST